MDTTLFAYLREHPPKGHSLEYADCRLSLLSAQKGKCAVSVGWFLQPDSIVCHMRVPKEQGGQERYSNPVLLHRRYLPLLADQEAAALKSIGKQLTVARKQPTKINNLRTAAKLAAIRYTANHIFGYIELDEQHAIIEVAVPEDWLGHSIGELDIRRKYGVNILGVKRNGKTDVNISPETVLDADMTLLVLGENKNSRSTSICEKKEDRFSDIVRKAAFWSIGGGYS